VVWLSFPTLDLLIVFRSESEEKMTSGSKKKQEFLIFSKNHPNTGNQTTL